MVDFSAITSQAAGEHNAPQSLPAGVYLGSWRQGELKERKTQNNPEGVGICEVVFAVTEPLDGVDQDELERREIDFSRKTVKHTFWLMDTALWVLDDKDSGVFVKAGLETSGKTLGDCLQEMVGQELKLVIEENPTKDGLRTWNGIKSFLSVNE